MTVCNRNVGGNHLNYIQFYSREVCCFLSFNLILQFLLQKAKSFKSVRNCWHVLGILLCTFSRVFVATFITFLTF
jgi:hypothetical protein